MRLLQEKLKKSYCAGYHSWYRLIRQISKVASSHPGLHDASNGIKREHHKVDGRRAYCSFRSLSFLVQERVKGCLLKNKNGIVKRTKRTFMLKATESLQAKNCCGFLVSHAKAKWTLWTTHTAFSMFLCLCPSTTWEEIVLDLSNAA